MMTNFSLYNDSLGGSYKVVQFRDVAALPGIEVQWSLMVCFRIGSEQDGKVTLNISEPREISVLL